MLNKFNKLSKRFLSISNNELSIPLNFYKSRHKLPTYLDIQSTTPIDPRVIKSMTPYYDKYFGNPHSRTHKYGWDAADAIEDARKK